MDDMMMNGGGSSGACSPSDPSGALKWSEMDLSHVNLNTSWPHLQNPSRNFESSPFPVDPVINSRVALWFGDMLALTVDGLTQTTNETIDQLPEHILTRTGPQYLGEIRQQLRSLRTGEARVVSSHHNLPCRDLVLTVTPRFSEKYRTAAETALFSCYKSVLEVVNKNISNLKTRFVYTFDKHNLYSIHFVLFVSSELVTRTWIV